MDYIVGAQLAFMNDIKALHLFYKVNNSLNFYVNQYLV